MIYYGFFIFLKELFLAGSENCFLSIPNYYHICRKSVVGVTHCVTRYVSGHVFSFKLIDRLVMCLRVRMCEMLIVKSERK